jgi:hypothetical protein
MNSPTPLPGWWKELLLSLRPLFLGIFLQPVQLAIVLLVFAVTCCGVGQDFGVPDLFWNENGFTQAAAGAGVTWLLGITCFVGYMLDTRHDWLNRDLGEHRPSPTPRPWIVSLRPWRVLFRVTQSLLPVKPAAEYAGPWRQMQWYLSVTWLPLLMILLVHDAVLYIVQLIAPTLGFTQRPSFVAGMAFALVVARSLAQLFHRSYGTNWANWLKQFSAKSPGTRLGWHLGVLVLFILLYILCNILYKEPTSALLCSLLTLAVAADAILFFLFRLATVKPAEKWRHLLAAGVFGTLFLVHQALFLAYLCLMDRGFFFPSPALVICLLLALLAAVVGFFRFHFGRLHGYAVALVLVVGAAANGLQEFKVRFPRLEKYYASPVPLLTDDLPTLWEQLDSGGGTVGVCAPSGKELFVRAIDNLDKRLLAARKAAGAPQPASGPRAAPAAATPGELWERYQEVHQQLQQLEQDRLNAWSRQAQGQGGGGRRPVLAVVCVSGGASRSAYWTTLVLNELERQWRNDELDSFPRHVRVITGASGGMVGAAYWTAALDKEGHDASSWDNDSQKIARDHLTSVSQRLLFLDLPMTFLPAPSTTDRGRALEEAWNRNMDDHLKVTFQDLAPGETEGWRPSLIFSPLLVEDGRLLLISNLYLPFLTENVGWSASPTRPVQSQGSATAGAGQTAGENRQVSKDTTEQELVWDCNFYRYSLQAIEFFQLFPEPDWFLLGTAARMNASFPYVSPAADLPTCPRRRVADAGYFDNYGVSVAAAWLFHYGDWLKKHTSGIVLIQIRDGVSESQRVQVDPREGAWNWSRGIEWLTGPLTGAKSARASVMSFRNDQQVQLLNEYFNKHSGKQCDDHFTTVVFECPVPIAMTWLVTDQHKREMEEGLEKGSAVKNSLAQLKQWWKRRQGMP